jgi:hypothetical protein
LAISIFLTPDQDYDPAWLSRGGRPPNGGILKTSGVEGQSRDPSQRHVCSTGQTVEAMAGSCNVDGRCVNRSANGALWFAKTPAG